MKHDQTSGGDGGPFLTPAELSQRWGFTRGSLANMRSRGHGPAFLNLNGRTVRYRRADVEAFEKAALVARP
jgi:hypothetical protein